VVSNLVNEDGHPKGSGNRLRNALISRRQLFPQVFRLVDEYVHRKVDFRGEHPCELGHQRYVERVVERLLAPLLNPMTLRESRL
jgi:hypothetical protein